MERGTPVADRLLGDARPGLDEGANGTHMLFPRGLLQGSAAGVFKGGVQVNAMPGELLDHLDLVE